MLEVPDVVEDKNKVGVDLFDQFLRLERRKGVAALQIGRMKRQAAIADRLAGIADTEIVNLMATAEPPHDAVHYPRQTGAVRVEADGDELEAGTTHRHAVFMLCHFLPRIRVCRITQAGPARVLQRTIPALQSRQSAFCV